MNLYLENDGGAHTATVHANPQHGTVALDPDGSFVYTPNAEFLGIDSFQYMAVNAGQPIGPTTVYLYVVDWWPRAIGDEYYVLYSPVPEELSGNVLSNDLVANGAELEASVQVSHGTLSPLATDGTFTYVPDAGFVGDDTFQYWAVNLATNERTLATVNIHVIQPVANADYYATDLNTIVDVTVTGHGVLSNDQHMHSVQLASGPSHGTLVLQANGKFSYAPDAGYAGNDSFQYRARNYSTGYVSPPTTVTIQVATPWAFADTYFANAGEELFVGLPGVRSNDINANTVQLVSGAEPEHGVLTLNSDGSFTYTPEAGYVGDDSFQYEARNAATGLFSGAATVTIHVQSTAPIAHDDSFYVSLQHFSNYDLAGILNHPNVLDNDENATSARVIGGGNYFDMFSQVVIDSSGTIQTLAGYNEIPTVYFRYVAQNESNGYLQESLPAFGMVQFLPPVANDDFAFNTAGNAAECNVLTNDEFGVRAELLPGSGGPGTLTFDEYGWLNFAPDEGYEGSFTVQYVAIHDPTGLRSAPATVTIQIGYDPLGLEGEAIASEAAALLMTQLLAISDAAAERWRGAGVSEAALDDLLAVLQFEIVDLPGAHLGGVFANGRVLIDRNAAGYGWFVDSTAGDDVEFGQSVSASERRAGSLSEGFERADLLSVVMHEMGHLLGLEHVLEENSSNLMGERIGLGTRRLPTAQDAMLANLIFAETPLKRWRV